MSYTVRLYREDDAQALADIAAAAITGMGPQGYSAQQVRAWASRHPGARLYRERAEQGAMIFVAVDAEDRPAAYALLEPDGHLDRLFCHPDHARRGLGSRLLAAAEGEARIRSVTRLHTEASELARPVFVLAGYRVLERRDFAIEHAGTSVPIHNYAMEKRLS